MTPNPQQLAEVVRWRRTERDRLIKGRLAMSTEARRDYAERISENLEQLIGSVSGLTVSAYWPFRGEPDLRPMFLRLHERRGRLALPVVISRAQPLVFRAWIPSEPLERGVWNIPVPKPDAEVVAPDVVIAPLVGFDRDCYRLGYGGGFFDRTLTAMQSKTRVFAVGYDQTELETIFPQPHDVPMDVIVTESRVIGRLSRLTQPH